MYICIYVMQFRFVFCINEEVNYFFLNDNREMRITFFGFVQSSFDLRRKERLQTKDLAQRCQ